MSAQWYYDAGGRQAGPLDESMLVELIRNKDVRPETLVWREGLENWSPCSQVPELARHLPAARPPRAPAPPPAMPGFSPAPATAPVEPAVMAGAALAPGSRFCAHCGGRFDENDMIHYQGAHICAACKPAYFQKLREGVAVDGGMNYAGFWIRFVAKFIDGLIIGIPAAVVMVIVLFATGMMEPDANNPAALFANLGLRLVLQLGVYVVGATYSGFMHSKYGATLGKMAVGLRVVTLDGRYPSFARAFGRGFAEILSGFCCNIGYIIAGFDEQKRALHDHICATRVVYK